MGSQQQFCLRWNNHATNLVGVFEDLLQTENLVDVTLACDGHTMKAHKVVLSACSPYFRKIFMENPCKHPVIILKDVRFDDMKVLVDFMYKGEVNVSQDQLTTLLNVAETLKVKGLAEVTESMTSSQAELPSTVQLASHHAATTESSVQQSQTAPYPIHVLSASDGRCTPPPKRRKRVKRPSGGSHSEDSRGPKESSTSSHEIALSVVPKTEVVDISYEDPLNDTSREPASPTDENQLSSATMGDISEVFESTIETEPFVPCQPKLVEMEDNCSSQHAKAQPSTSSDHQSSMYFPSSSALGLSSDVPSAVAGPSTSSLRPAAAPPTGQSSSHGSKGQLDSFALASTRGLIWEYVTPIGTDTLCNICKCILKGLVSSNVKTHLRTKHLEIFKHYVRREQKVWSYFTALEEGQQSCNVCNAKFMRKNIVNALVHLRTHGSDFRI